MYKAMGSFYGVILYASYLSLLPIPPNRPVSAPVIYSYRQIDTNIDGTDRDI